MNEIDNRAVLVRGCQIGKYTYIEEYTHVSQNVRIGKYCSIANLCTIGAQPHQMDKLTTWPAPGCGGDTRETIVGNDVWIGCSAVVLAGLTIGDGAVIGAGSVVTKDVPPYGIAYGNPAKVARYRFGGQVISDLLETKWWDLPHAFVITLTGMEIGECIKAIRRERDGI